jgi:hypothetical protein
MSILDALRLQRTEQNSVRDLAMLPQAQIMQLAQTGQIPAEVVPVIISEKARMAQTAAQMQAAQQQPQPTVIEQAMAQNAQSETPMNGVAAIPTQMFNEQNYASGGIVAFQRGGPVDPTSVIYGGDEAQDSPAVASPAVGSLDAYIREAAARRAEARKPSESMLALERSLTEPGRFREAKDEARNMALLQAGLGILGGTSPYALQNIGRGAAGAVDTYGTQMRDIRRQERESLGQRAALDLKKQEQALADIASGEASYSAARKEALEGRKIESAEERERIRAEANERRQELRNQGLIEAMTARPDAARAGFVNDYVAGKKASGDTRSEAILRMEAQQQFNVNEDRNVLQRAQLIAGITSDVDRLVAKMRDDPSTPDRRALREWQLANPRKSIDDYYNDIKQRMIQARYSEIAQQTPGMIQPSASPRAAPAPASAQPRPDAAPERLRFNSATGAFE